MTRLSLIITTKCNCSNMNTLLTASKLSIETCFTWNLSQNAHRSCIIKATSLQNSLPCFMYFFSSSNPVTPCKYKHPCAVKQCYTLQIQTSVCCETMLHPAKTNINVLWNNVTPCKHKHLCAVKQCYTLQIQTLMCCETMLHPANTNINVLWNNVTPCKYKHPCAVKQCYTLQTQTLMCCETMLHPANTNIRVLWNNVTPCKYKHPCAV